MLGSKDDRTVGPWLEEPMAIKQAQEKALTRFWMNALSFAYLVVSVLRSTSATISLVIQSGGKCRPAFHSCTVRYGAPRSSDSCLMFSPAFMRASLIAFSDWLSIAHHSPLPQIVNLAMVVAKLMPVASPMNQVSRSMLCHSAISQKTITAKHINLDFIISDMVEYRYQRGRLLAPTDCPPCLTSAPSTLSTFARLFYFR